MDSESSENIYSILKTSFLGLFPCLGKAQSSQSENFQKSTIFEISILFYIKMSVPIPTFQGPKSQNTPEMNVSESDKKFLQIWAHNFEKQKS